MQISKDETMGSLVVELRGITLSGRPIDAQTALDLLKENAGDLLNRTLEQLQQDLNSFEAESLLSEASREIAHINKLFRVVSIREAKTPVASELVSIEKRKDNVLVKEKSTEPEIRPTETSKEPTRDEKEPNRAEKVQTGKAPGITIKSIQAPKIKRPVIKHTDRARVAAAKVVVTKPAKAKKEVSSPPVKGLQSLFGNLV